MVRRSQEERSAAATAKTLEAALELFSTQGFRATSLRQIAERAGLSVGNIYHHFPDKEALYNRLFEEYWARLLDPDLPLNRVFAKARFPEDLEEMADAIESVVEENAPYILLIYVDVIEFGGQHIQTFYRDMADRFQRTYASRFEERRRAGELGEVDPMVGVMVASRWLFYFFTVEKCFGVPMHLGLTPQQAVREFIQLIRLGLLPRSGDPPGGESLSDSRSETKGGSSS